MKILNKINWKNEGITPPKTVQPDREKRGINPPKTTQPKEKQKQK